MFRKPKKPENVDPYARYQRTGAECAVLNLIINQLQAYTDRIDGGKYLAREADFFKFIWPFGKEKRGENRRINYRLAQVLLASLKDLRADIHKRVISHISVLLIPYQREGLYLKHGPHIIRSGELVRIIKKAMRLVESFQRTMAHRLTPR